ncbi:hypothetical protein CORC01_12434 [Colletotrichum orchidophilum]|uniref:Uncharacterized protein n=1 Tax=Colletotrichum orchidophilum TaxID=1209926 RepID=A0A1G4AT24_9PEZI|nr:uncharacterized protein CORC01_12434 [Colletotrichum orchidophilum]OHE92265.1 hypothetical protein CORC01_12434 [Colletotrichum orchidophilum]
MGGSAFTSGDDPLDTPRMPAKVYERAKADCFAALRELFLCVASPIEGPEKQDYGDIDILVIWERAPFVGKCGGESAPEPVSRRQEERETDEEWFEMVNDEKDGQERTPGHSIMSKEEARKAIFAALGAKRAIYNNVGDNYAIPWPVTETEAEASNEPKRYIQVDLIICNSLQQLQWILFKHAHGDLWSILQTIIQPRGLTVDDYSMSLRNNNIERFERYSKKWPKVHLSRDPAEVLVFLGLDVARFSEPFATRVEMYEYIASCRLFCIETDHGRYNNPDATNPKMVMEPKKLEDMGNMDVDSVEGPARKKLKGKNKQRLLKRPAFRDWFEEFLPRCRAEGRYADRPQLFTSDVHEEAFARWGKFGPWFWRLHMDLMRSLGEERVRAKIKEVVQSLVPGTDAKDSQYRGLLNKAFKKIILDGDPTYGVTPEENFRDGMGQMIKDQPEKFILKHHEEVGQTAVAEHERKYEEHRRMREEKKSKSNL